MSIRDALERLVPPFGGGGSWDDVLERAGQGGRSRRRSIALLAIAAAALVAAVVGFERGDAGAVQVPEPGFAPIDGWTATRDDNVARASSVDGTVLVARFSPRTDATLERVLPLRLSEAVRVRDGHRRIRAAVGIYDVVVDAYFGAREPSRAQLADAQEQLDRLAVPAVTISADPKIVGADRNLTLFGAIAEPRAGQDIKLEEKTCSTGYWKQSATWGNSIRTNDAGRWSADRIVIYETTQFRAEWWERRVKSPPITVLKRVSVYLGPVDKAPIEIARGDTLRVSASTTARTIVGRAVRIERLTNDGWKLVRWLTLKRDSFGYASTRYKPNLPPGTQLRAVVPQKFAGRCNLAGYSKILRLP